MATIKPPKPKLCKNCGEIFTPRSSIQSTCSPKCANELKRKKDSEKQKSRDEAEAFVESVTGKRPATYSTKDKPVKIRVCRCGKEFPASFGRTACSQRCADEAAMERRRNREESTASNPLAEMRKTSPIPESNELAELRKIDGLRKNSVREVSAETKREVLERDNGRCVVGMMLQGESQNCNCLESVPHHAFY